MFWKTPILSSLQIPQITWQRNLQEPEEDAGSDEEEKVEAGRKRGTVARVLVGEFPGFRNVGLWWFNDDGWWNMIFVVVLLTLAYDVEWFWMMMIGYMMNVWYMLFRIGYICEES